MRCCRVVWSRAPCDRIVFVLCTCINLVLVSVDRAALAPASEGCQRLTSRRTVSLRVHVYAATSHGDVGRCGAVVVCATAGVGVSAARTSGLRLRACLFIWHVAALSLLQPCIRIAPSVVGVIIHHWCACTAAVVTAGGGDAMDVAAVEAAVLAEIKASRSGAEHFRVLGLLGCGEFGYVFKVCASGNKCTATHVHAAS
jgi:hypothetical protein